MTRYNLLQTLCDNCGLMWFAVDGEHLVPENQWPDKSSVTPEECTTLHCPRCLHVNDSSIMNIDDADVDDEPAGGHEDGWPPEQKPYGGHLELTDADVNRLPPALLTRIINGEFS